MFVLPDKQEEKFWDQLEEKRKFLVHLQLQKYENPAKRLVELLHKVDQFWQNVKDDQLADMLLNTLLDSQNLYYLLVDGSMVVCIEQ